MRDLHKFFEVPFDDKGIALDKLTTFANDHLGRMSANNTGGFLTARIAATTTALAAIESGSTGDQIKLAIRKSLVQAKEEFRRDLPKDILKVYSACLGHYEENSVEMAAIFPEGRSIFSSCKDDALNNKLNVMVAGVTAKLATLGAPLVAQAEAIGTNWTAIYAASKGASGAQTTTQTAKNTARAALQLELFLNLLALATQFPRQPEMLDLYMVPSLLETHPPGEEPPADPPPGP